MKNFYKKVIALGLLAISIVCLLFSGIYFGIQGIYENSYQKGFIYQYRALENADAHTGKIIVIGGSYMTFSTDSSQLSEMTDMPVYTLGIHSGMGMDYIIETAEKFANSGDIIVFSFLPFKAKYYGMDLIYMSLDSEDDMFWDFFKEHPFEVIKSAGAEIFAKVQGLWTYYREKDSDITSVYDARAFDPNSGNLIYPRLERKVADENLYWRNPLTVENVTEECISETKELAQYCEENNIKYYMLYSPFFEGYYENCTDSGLNTYQLELEKRLGIPFIVDINDCVMPKDYTYNGALHMNDSGKDYYTELIYKGLMNVEAFGSLNVTDKM